MKFLCTNCNYVFDKALWDVEEKIEIWTELDKCPVCEEYDTFQWIEEEINYIDIDSLGALEIDHIPEIKIKDNKLIVTIANEIHPMGEGHRIASIWLYDEYWDLIEEKYLELETEANVEFDFDDLDEFEIRTKCSVHWVWARKFVN
jgi:desulfoferrodoxin (superoxide reductase-like protein)